MPTTRRGHPPPGWTRACARGHWKIPADGQL